MWFITQAKPPGDGPESWRLVWDWSEGVDEDLAARMLDLIDRMQATTPKSRRYLLEDDPWNPAALRNPFSPAFYESLRPLFDGTSRVVLAAPGGEGAATDDVLVFRSAQAAVEFLRAVGANLGACALFTALGRPLTVDAEGATAAIGPEAGRERDPALARRWLSARYEALHGAPPDAGLGVRELVEAVGVDG